MVVDDQHKLIAAQPRHGVATAQAARQARSHLLEQLITRRMAQAVVDELEVVQVDEHQRQVVAHARSTRYALRDAVVQQHPVGQAREQVVVGLALQLLLVVAPLGNILHRALVAQKFALRPAHDMGVFGDPDARAIAPMHLGFKIEHLPLRLHEPVKHLAPPGLDVKPPVDVRQVGHQRGGRVVAVNARQRRVSGQVVAIARSLKNALAGVLEDVAVAQLGVLQRLQRGLALGDVLDKAFQHQHILLIAHGHAAFGHIARLPRQGGDAVLHGKALPAGHGALDDLAHPQAVIGVGDVLPRHARASEQLRRGVARQLGTALADKHHRPVGIVEAAVGHAFEVVDQRVQHAGAVDDFRR